jgi:hypothetical protein
MDDRYIRNGPQGDYYERSPETVRDFGSGRDHTYSSARDYAAAGELGRGREFGRGGRDFDRPYGRESGRRDYGGSYWDDGRRTIEARGRRDSYDDDRGFLDRAGDEVRSWFGDEEAERRREIDRRRMREQDDHYGQWRSSRLAEFDRDYDEYRRENAQRFHNEFTSWRTERQGQRDSLLRVAEHMEVLGSDGAHLGTVDKVRGDRILLTKSDADAGGHHHSIPSRWIASVDDKVTLSKTADEARNQWRDEERSALGWEDREDKGGHILTRAFSGTY